MDLWPPLVRLAALHYRARVCAAPQFGASTERFQSVCVTCLQKVNHPPRPSRLLSLILSALVLSAGSLRLALYSLRTMGGPGHYGFPRPPLSESVVTFCSLLSAANWVRVRRKVPRQKDSAAVNDLKLASICLPHEERQAHRSLPLYLLRLDAEAVLYHSDVLPPSSLPSFPWHSAAHSDAERTHSAMLNV